jgi:tartronate-semialdehyde synthase
MIEELAVGAQFNLPYIHVVVNNSYLGLIRQAQRAFEMDYAVQLSFDNVNSPEMGGYGVDHVKVAEGLGLQGTPGAATRRAAASVRRGEEADGRIPRPGRRRGDLGAGHQHLHGH